MIFYEGVLSQVLFCALHMSAKYLTRCIDKIKDFYSSYIC